VADAVERLARTLAERLAAGESLEHAMREIVAGTYRRHGRIVFGGDGYSAEWEREAEARGLLNLRTTPDALAQLVSDATVRVFAERGVLSARELEARYEVLVEQYATTLNIEAETAAALARTLVLPAALRHRALVDQAHGPLTDELLLELDEPLTALARSLRELEAVNAAGPAAGVAPAEHMRDAVVPAMASVREHADRLERIVAGDLWPLPKYAEMLFVR
jgi:glutamine synthetase